jgi:hypothetical protein
VSGHVFITWGDLTRLACDAWLVPTDGRLVLEEPWNRFVVAPAERPAGWGSGHARVVAGRALTRNDARTPWLLDVGGSAHTELQWYVDGVTEFVNAATPGLAGRDPLYGRSKRLLGIPLVGARYGGSAERAGQLVSSLLPALADLASGRDVDIALVLYNPAAFAGAQAARRRRRAGPPPDLGARAVEEAERLARLAADGRLVLFLGAGVSAGAGLPTWNELLKQLAAEADIDERGLALLTRLEERDRALVIEGRLKQRGSGLGQLIARSFQGNPWRSLTHTQLAALPVTEAATTNYDTLFEDARRDIRRDTTVLPYELVGEDRRWLLKLHGCVTHPDDIVLTRDDYLRYNERRAALAGILQALLVTRHMLFVGFSLRDENFHRIMHDVRRALRVPGATSRGPFGTVLLLHQYPFLDELWREDLHLVDLGGERDDTQAAARRLQIFLDYVLQRSATSVAHLLDDAYDAVLDPDERAVRDALRALKAVMPAEGQRTPAWLRVADFLQTVGDKAADPQD